MKMSKLQLIALTGLSCVALLGATYFLPTEPVAPAAPPDPEAGRGNATAPVAQAEQVGVPGSETKYPTRIESTVGKQQVQLALTGTAMRKKVIVNVYTIASYADEKVAIANADQLCTKDCVKQLHLVMETGVTGKQMIDAFTDGIRANHPKPKFESDIAALGEKLWGMNLAKGDHVWLTYVPEVGLKVDVVGKFSLAIDNPAFATAMWEIYLGKKNISEQIKTSLASRLK